MLRILLAVALLMPAVHGQGAPKDAFPNLADPIGEVVDENGAAIAGASVRLEVQAHPSSGFATACAQVLEQPLPHAASGRDGTFVLPLSFDQRRLGAAGELRVWLVVEKAGYVPWVEPLGEGLWGWVGSRVRLRAERAADHVTLRLAQPGSAEIVRLRRTGPFAELPSRILEVPASGVVDVALPLLPTPLLLPEMRTPQAVGWSAERWAPGCSGVTLDVPAAPAELELPALEKARTTKVTRRDGGAVTGLRGLYRLPDGHLRWLAAAGDELAQGAIAAQADGTLAAPAGEPLAPRTEEPVQLMVLDAQGTAIAEARVRLYRLVDASAPGEALAVGARAAWTGHTDGSGSVTLPDAPHAMLARIEAPGYAHTDLIEPRALREPRVTLAPVATGAARVRIVDHVGRGVAQASLHFDDACYAAGGLLERPPQSDRSGVCLVEHVPTGSHEALVIAEGSVPQVVHFTVQEGQRQEVSVQLAAAAATRIVLTRGGDARAAFVPVSVTGTAADNGQPYRPPVAPFTDSCGRLWLRGWPASETLHLTIGSASVTLEQVGDVWVGKAGDAEDAVVLPLPRGCRLTGRVGGGGSSGVAPPDDQGSHGVLLMWWNKGRNDDQFLCVAGEPPLRINDDLVQRAERDAEGVRRLSQGTERRIPLSIVDAEGRPIAGVHVQPDAQHGFTKLNYLYGDMVMLAENKLWWHARDDGAYRCLAFHPEYLAQRFDVPARKPGVADAPIEVRLKRGVPVSFVVRFAALPAPPASAMLTMTGKAGGMLLLAIEALPRITAADLGKPLVLPSLAALPAGDYTLNLTFHGAALPALQREITLRDGEPCGIDVDAQALPRKGK